MNSATDRRNFFGRMLSAAAVAGLPFTAKRANAAPEASPDAWLNEVKGTHRCLFDFPQHRGGFPLLHILNYLSTYGAVYKAAPGQAAAVGTFYGLGPQSSIALGFNDSMWAKYKFGEYLGLKDMAGKPYTRNLFARPAGDDLHVMLDTIQSPLIPGLKGAMPALGIESLQKMGTKFILCANALGGWVMELEVRGKGKAADIEKELRANLLPGVTIVPAMVIAIEKAQEAGIRYNRQ